MDHDRASQSDITGDYSGRGGGPGGDVGGGGGGRYILVDTGPPEEVVVHAPPKPKQPAKPVPKLTPVKLPDPPTPKVPDDPEAGPCDEKLLGWSDAVRYGARTTVVVAGAAVLTEGASGGGSSAIPATAGFGVAAMAGMVALDRLGEFGQGVATGRIRKSALDIGQSMAFDFAQDFALQPLGPPHKIIGAALDAMDLVFKDCPSSKLHLGIFRA